MPEYPPRVRPGRPALGCFLVLLLAAAVPHRLEAQDAGTDAPDAGLAESIARADSIRAEMEAVRPPNDHPTDFVDIVGVPFKVIAFPIHFVLVYIPSYVAGQLTLPRPPGFLVRTYRDLAAVGIRPVLHTSIGPHSGIAAGVTYNPIEPLLFESAFSLKSSQRHRASLRFPLEGSPVRVEAEGGWQRDAQASFFGIGPEAPGVRTRYRRDRATAALRADLDSPGPLRLEAEAGYEDNLVDEPIGADEEDRARFDSLAARVPFGAEGRQRYVRIGASAGLDLTERGPFQSRGVRMFAGARAYRGVRDTDSDFHVWSFEAQGLVPLNPRQLLALRGLTELARGGAGEVPFYHLPTLGGERTAIGYPDGRFADLDMISLSAEWRYEIWRDIHNGVRLESFLHGGAGAVGPRLGEIGSDDWQPSYGFGFRVARAEGLMGLVFLGFSDESVHFGASGEWSP